MRLIGIEKNLKLVFHNSHPSVFISFSCAFFLFLNVLSFRCFSVIFLLALYPNCIEQDWDWDNDTHIRSPNQPYLRLLRCIRNVDLSSTVFFTNVFFYHWASSKIESMIDFLHMLHQQLLKMFLSIPISPLEFFASVALSLVYRSIKKKNDWVRSLDPACIVHSAVCRLYEAIADGAVSVFFEEATIYVHCALFLRRPIE